MSHTFLLQVFFKVLSVPIRFQTQVITYTCLHIEKRKFEYNQGILFYENCITHHEKHFPSEVPS